jgi:hypothetical protein
VRTIELSLGDQFFEGTERPIAPPSLSKSAAHLGRRIDNRSEADVWQRLNSLGMNVGYKTGTDESDASRYGLFRQSGILMTIRSGSIMAATYQRPPAHPTTLLSAMETFDPTGFSHYLQRAVGPADPT